MWISDSIIQVLATKVHLSSKPSKTPKPCHRRTDTSKEVLVAATTPQPALMPSSIPFGITRGMEEGRGGKGVNSFHYDVSDIVYRDQPQPRVNDQDCLLLTEQVFWILTMLSLYVTQTWRIYLYIHKGHACSVIVKEDEGIVHATNGMGQSSGVSVTGLHGRAGDAAFPSC